MKIGQIHIGSLEVAAYYIESNGKVAIIGSLRETTDSFSNQKRQTMYYNQCLKTSS